MYLVVRTLCVVLSFYPTGKEEREGAAKRTFILLFLFYSIFTKNCINPHNSIPKVEATEEEISLRESRDQALLMVSSKNVEIATLKMELSEQIDLVRIKNERIEKFEKESELQNVEVSELKKTIDEKIKASDAINEENEKLMKKNTKLRQLLEEGDEELKQLKNDNGIFIEKNKRLRWIFKLVHEAYSIS